MSYVTAFGSHRRKPRLKRSKQEELYLYFSPRKDPPTDEGRQQFLEHESHGVVPVEPDGFYLRICEGKKWFEWQQNEFRDHYLHPEYWWGWDQLRVDWDGHHWKLKELFRWHKAPELLPDWLKAAEWQPPSASDSEDE